MSCPEDACLVSFDPDAGEYIVALAAGGEEFVCRREDFEFLDALRIEAEVVSLRPECVDYFLDPDDEERLFGL